MSSLLIRSPLVLMANLHSTGLNSRSYKPIVVYVFHIKVLNLKIRHIMY